MACAPQVAYMVWEPLTRDQSELPPRFSQPLTHIPTLCSEQIFLVISESCVVYSKNLSQEFTHQSLCCQEHGNYSCNTKDV